MANPELVDFIKKERNKGFTNKNIRDALINAGWLAKYIDEAFNEADVVKPLPKISAQEEQVIPNGEEVKEKPDKERPSGVTVIAIFHFIFAILNISVGVLFLLGNSILMGMVPPEQAAFLGAYMMWVSIFILVLGVAYIEIGIGLLKLKNWARITAIIISILTIFSILPIIPLIILFKKSTKEAFGVG